MPSVSVYLKDRPVTHRWITVNESLFPLRLAITYHTDTQDHDAVLNNAFDRFNIGGNDDPVVAKYRGAGNRSLSVGDVVVIDGTPYLCEPFGWDIVDAPTTQEEAS